MNVADLHQCLDVEMSRLSSIWDRIGIHGDQRVSRCNVVLLHISNLLHEMVEEEDALFTRLATNAERLKVELVQLCEELEIPAYEVSRMEDLNVEYLC